MAGGTFTPRRRRVAALALSSAATAASGNVDGSEKTAGAGSFAILRCPK